MLCEASRGSTGLRGVQQCSAGLRMAPRGPMRPHEACWALPATDLETHRCRPQSTTKLGSQARAHDRLNRVRSATHAPWGPVASPHCTSPAPAPPPLGISGAVRHAGFSSQRIASSCCVCTSCASSFVSSSIGDGRVRCRPSFQPVRRASADAWQLDATQRAEEPTQGRRVAAAIGMSVDWIVRQSPRRVHRAPREEWGADVAGRVDRESVGSADGRLSVTWVQ